LIHIGAQNRLNQGLKGHKMDTKEAVKILPHKLPQASILRTYLTVSILQTTALNGHFSPETLLRL